MAYTFDEDTAVEPGPGGWRAVVSDRWSIAGIPNGGYVMSLMLRAVSREVAHPDPLTTTAHFLSPTSPGPALVRVEVLKQGRSLSTAAVELVQDGRSTVAMLTTWGNLDDLTGPSNTSKNPPPVDGPITDEAVVGPPAFAAIASRFRYTLPVDATEGFLGRPTGNPELTGRIEFADGRPADGLAMPLIVDAFPPAVFQLGHYGWTPTIELTVHLRARPAPGPLTCRIATRFLHGGMGEEDVEVWDRSGRLVGMSRQLLRTADQAKAGATWRPNNSNPEVS